MLADKYCLTHKSFEKRVGKAVSHQEGRNPESISLHQVDIAACGEGSCNQQGRVPGGPTCFYCKRRGHAMSECWSLE